MADSQNDITSLALEGKIRRTHILIEEAKEKLKEQRDMFKSAFENDPVYQDHEGKHEEAKGILLATKKQILKDPAVASIEERIKEIRLALKQLQDSLSEDLQEYQSQTGEKVIEVDEGRLMEIVSRARLIRRV